MVKVLCVGGCHWDIRLIANQSLDRGESTPVTSVTTKGGAVSNLGRTLRRQGHQVEIASVVGRNPPECSSLSKVLNDQASGRYITVENQDGTLVYGLADLDLYRHMDHQWYQSLSDASEGFDAVVLDCNAPAKALAGFQTTRPVFGLAVSPAKVRNFDALLPSLEGLFVNRLEAERLGEGVALPNWTVKTKGAQGAVLLRRGVEAASWPAPGGVPKHINGLGDRLAGLTLSQVLEGASPQQAIGWAMANLFEDWEMQEC